MQSTEYTVFSSLSASVSLNVVAVFCLSDLLSVYCCICRALPKTVNFSSLV